MKAHVQQLINMGASIMDKIKLLHGDGGKYTDELIQQIFYTMFDNEILSRNDDAAIINLPSNNTVAGKIAFTTDSFVIKPIFFKGGDIGKLCVSGTVNDILTSGAKPMYLSLGLIIEEGFEIDKLKKIVRSIADTAKIAGVKIVTGDTKVVEHGDADGIYINTTGIGIGNSESIIKGNINSGDKIIITGTIAEHGTAIAVERYDIHCLNDIYSDCMPLSNIYNIVNKFNGQIKKLKDPTRGGIGTVLNELASKFKLGVKLLEDKIPVSDDVAAITELLGLDPIYMASEGRMLVVVEAGHENEVLNELCKYEEFKASTVIGEFTDETKFVYIENSFGGQRIIGSLDNLMLPRIC